MCSSEILEGQCTNPSWLVRRVYGIDGSGVLFENMTDEEAAWHRSEAIDVDSGADSDQDEEAGSLDDFVVDDEAIEGEQDSEEYAETSDKDQSSKNEFKKEGVGQSEGSEVSDASSDSGIRPVSPPRRLQNNPSETVEVSDDSPPPQPKSKTELRQRRLQALQSLRRRRTGMPESEAQGSDDTSEDTQGEEEYDSESEDDVEDHGSAAEKQSSSNDENEADGIEYEYEENEENTEEE